METNSSDIIALEGMHFYAYHGYYEEERERGNKFIVDLYVKADLEPAGKQDDLGKTVNYELLYALVEKIMHEKSKLLEHIAYKILEEIGLKFGAIRAARVKISKLNPPIKGDIEKVSVERQRTFGQN